MLPRELRQYSNRKVFITLGAIIGLAFITTAAAVVALSVMLIYRQGAQNYNDSRVDVQALMTDMYRSAAIEREYILAGNQSDLELYRQLIAKIPRRLDDVERSAAPTTVMPSIDRIRPLVTQILNEQDKAIASYRAGENTALVTFENGTETSLISQLSNLVEQIQEGDLTQLEIDRSRINLLARTARDVSLGALAITLLLAVMVYYLYLKGIQAERRLDRAKDEFVSLASHQLRTPATGVKSILAMLVAGDVGPLNTRQLHFATKAMESNERGLAIIEELLDVAKADAGRLVLNATAFDMTELVNSVIVEQQPQIAAKGITLNVKVPSSPAEIVADRDKLYMAIGNLVDNARKYTATKGRIDVSLTNRSHEMRLMVIDTGCGIPKSELPHIFERFGRSSSSENTHVEGTGLGLYLVNRVIELHNGRIKVASRPGKGTKFVMIVPKRKS